MSFKTKDGTKSFMSGFKAKRYDREHSEGIPKIAEHEPKSSTEKVSDTPKPSEVVAEHGKAHKVIVSHDHEANKHSVESYHDDGHVNESDHESAGEAHDHARELSGAEMAGAEKAEQGAASEEQGFEQPDLV